MRGVGGEKRWSREELKQQIFESKAYHLRDRYTQLLVLNVRIWHAIALLRNVIFSDPDLTRSVLCDAMSRGQNIATVDQRSSAQVVRLVRCRS